MANFKADKNNVNPRNYPMYDFGIDHDILDSVGNLKLEEGIHGEWVIPEDAKASEIWAQKMKNNSFLKFQKENFYDKNI